MIKKINYYILIILLLTSCSQNRKEVILSDSLSDTLIDILLIDATFECSSEYEFEYPMARGLRENFQICSWCPLFEYNAEKRKLSIYSKFSNANIDKIKTLVQINYDGYCDKGLSSVGYLYTDDTIDIKTLGLLGKTTFNIISSVNGLIISTDFDTAKNSIKAVYTENLNGDNSDIEIIEKYRYKLIKNVQYEVLTDGYTCE